MGNFVESALGIQPPEPIQPVFTVIKGGLEAKYGLIVVKYVVNGRKKAFVRLPRHLRTV